MSRHTNASEWQDKKYYSENKFYQKRWWIETKSKKPEDKPPDSSYSDLDEIAAHAISILFFFLLFFLFLFLFSLFLFVVFIVFVFDLFYF